MIFEHLKYNIAVTDEDFDKIYPENIQALSKIHWTSVEVASKASKFLVSKPGSRILDIGSGVGKFCMIGAVTTKGRYTGVEYRKDLVKLSSKLISERGIRNAKIIYSNITDIKFNKFDAFYFYNPFHENIVMKGNIDRNIQFSVPNYIKYRDYVYNQFLNAPLQTRVVTYSGLDTEIPDCFKLKDVDEMNDLKFWIKEEATKLYSFDS